MCEEGTKFIPQDKKSPGKAPLGQANFSFFCFNTLRSSCILLNVYHKASHTGHRRLRQVGHYLPCKS